MEKADEFTISGFRLHVVFSVSGSSLFRIRVVSVICELRPVIHIF